MDLMQFSERERSFIEKAPVPFAVYQFVGGRVRTLALSEGFCKLFGYEDPAEAYRDMNGSVYRFAHPDDAARLEDAAYRFATEGGTFEVIYRTRNRRDGLYHIVHAYGKRIESDMSVANVWYMDEGIYGGDSGAASPGLNQSLSKALHEESILKASFYDYLTGLPSMTYFFELAQHDRDSLLAAGAQPVILFMDLSGMKFYNHKHGFAQGDKLLQDFALLLREHFGGDSCSRFGQDHFAVITRGEGLEGRLTSFFKSWKAREEAAALPVRVGVYEKGAESVSISTACDRAKLACDAIRKSYLSRVNYFNHKMLEAVERQQYIVSHLDQAIAEKWIQVYYQPIVRAINERVCDEEALARWIDPERGMLSPADFIPCLEDANLIYKLDLYMVEQILEKIRILEAEGLPIVPQSVNLSRADFSSCDIVEEIRRRVDAAGIERNKITIEITESVIGRDFAFMQEQIARFQALGFPVWMDDFGSGYSSLDVLQSIPFDLIKFDMRFMQQFHEGEKGKIILAELMKMAIGLGIDTVCEGVEDAEQVEFLREIGCCKIQGYYYSRPNSLAMILERYRTGKQIGFENPAEGPYFDAIGRINLYDLAVIANEETDSFRHYFNTLPMAILETRGEAARFARSNQSYRDFMRRTFRFNLSGKDSGFAPTPAGPGNPFMRMVRQCCEQGGRAIIDETMPDGSVVHSYVRRLAENKVTNTVAVVVVVLAVSDDDQGATYANIARALAADYFNLFYVNVETEEFIEYSSDPGHEELALERHGEDFFRASRRDAHNVLYEADREEFIKAFTRENVLKALDEQGIFTRSYRILRDGKPVYVNMKAVRMASDAKHIIIGVSDVDAQMKQQETAEKLRQEQVFYARIKALGGDFICMYTVDPVTERYYEYRATSDYAGLGLAAEGENFFEQSHKNGMRVLNPGDLAQYLRVFNRENVLREIRENGIFTMRYSLCIRDRWQPVELKAALVEESDGEKLIIGVSALDKRRKQEDQSDGTH